MSSGLPNRFIISKPNCVEFIILVLVKGHSQIPDMTIWEVSGEHLQTVNERGMLDLSVPNSHIDFYGSIEIILQKSHPNLGLNIAQGIILVPVEYSPSGVSPDDGVDLDELQVNMDSKVDPFHNVLLELGQGYFLDPVLGSESLVFIICDIKWVLELTLPIDGPLILIVQSIFKHLSKGRFLEIQNKKRSGQSPLQVLQVLHLIGVEMP
jgi:hypothetical protein